MRLGVPVIGSKSRLPTKDRWLESALEMVGNYFFEIASLLIATAALVYAALALRVAKEALVSGRGADLLALKLRAQEGRVRAERSFLSLQSACHEMRARWDLHHDRHYPKLGNQDFRNKETRHISQVERQGRELLRPLEFGLSSPEAGSATLEEYIHRAEKAAVEIEQLTLQLSPPKQLFV